VGLERGSLGLVSTIEELLKRKSSGSGLEILDTAVGIRHADHVHPLSAKMALTSPTSGGRSVGIVRSRTQATTLVIYIYIYIVCARVCVCVCVCVCSKRLIYTKFDYKMSFENRTR
jgi:hypothetical protein